MTNFMPSTLYSARRKFCLLTVLLFAAGLFCQGSLAAVTLTVNASSMTSNGLKKAGLGSLFGITTNSALGPWRYYMTNAFLFVSEHQNHIGVTGVPCSSSTVGPLLRGTPIKMMCRFGDLCDGWAPYRWPGLNPSWISPGFTYSWLQQVTNACNDIKNNYLDTVYAIAIFNEPEDELVDSNFFNDPNIVAGTQDQRVNYVWTQTYKAIRSIIPTVKIMGPNYEDWAPQSHSEDWGRMSNFLANAISTGTVPDVMGWHNLNQNPIYPATIGTSLSYYRSLETALNVPGRPLPLSIEEFGTWSHAFEGVPGQMVAYWGELERDGVEFGDMGIYENGGDLGNTMRYTMWDNNPQPNAGWWMMHWYHEMQGQYIPVTKASNGLDGVASWNSTNQTMTILLGGADGDATVQVNGLGALGFGNIVRVRLDMANWTTNAYVVNTNVASGGDPQTGGYNLYDNNFTLSGGNLAIPVNAVEGVYNGYRLLITSTNSTTNYPTKYEAESATVNHAIIYKTAQASGGSYVGGIDYSDSYVTFHVMAPSNGLYDVFIRYAASSAYGPATQSLWVNGQSQGVVNYPPTSGWSGTELRTTSRPVSLINGLNDITLAHATNYAELDFIDVRPSTHRYDAELATVNDANRYVFNTCYLPDCVGGINNADSYVSFNVFAPAAGDYSMSVAYGNGSSPGTFLVTNNGVGAGSVPLPSTGGWLGGGWMTGNNPSITRRVSTVPVNLNAGWNSIQLNKGVNYGEMDYINISPVATGPAASYAFQGNVLDSSGNGNDGIAYGALGYAASVNGGSAAVFNGVNSWVSIPISIGLTDFSIAMWIKTTDAYGNTSDQWYADHGLVDGEIPSTVSDFGTAIGGGRFKLGIGYTDTTLTSTTPINDGNWHQVVATWSAASGAMQIYLDGVLNTTGTGPTGPRNAVINGLHIGNSHDGNNFFNGSLTQVQLYNRVLTANEVAELAATTAPVTPTGIAAVGGNGEVMLNWTPSVGANNYLIKRSTTSGSEVTVASSATSSFTDTGLPTGTTYYYVVAATNAAGVSANSSEVSASTIAFPPLQMVTSINSGNQFAMSWPLWASNYSVYVSTNLVLPNWQKVTSVPEVSNGMYYLNLATTNGTQQFFRLANP